MILDVNDEIFSSEVLESDIPVLVDFWANWCGPCKMIAPIIDKIAEEYEYRLKICRVNIEDAPESTQNCAITNVPVILFVKNGIFAGQIVGVSPRFEDSLRDMIEQLLS